jgi:hypothetical protein
MLSQVRTTSPDVYRAASVSYTGPPQYRNSLAIRLNLTELLMSQSVHLMMTVLLQLLPMKQRLAPQAPHSDGEWGQSVICISANDSIHHLLVCTKNSHIKSPQAQGGRLTTGTVWQV